MPNYYPVDEAVLEPKAVFGTDLSTVQAQVAKNGAPVLARNAGTSTSRTLYPTASGGTPLTQPVLTVNGRIQAYVQGEAPYDLYINYGLPTQYVVTVTPPQVGAQGPAGPSGGGVVVANVTGDGSAQAANTTAIVNALASLPAFSGGYGGGTVLIVPSGGVTVAVNVNAINVTDGQELVGVGRMAPELQGNGAGDVITVSGSYPGLRNLYVKNLSANSAARALFVGASSGFRSELVYYQGAAVGGHIVRMTGALLVEFHHSKTGGSGAGVCDAGLHADGNCNGISLLSARFTDTKSGARLLNLLTASVTGACQFESLGGGSSDGYDGGLILDGVDGAAVLGNYFEAITGYGIATYHNVRYSTGVVIGGNSLQTCSNSSYITIGGLQDSEVLPNTIYPSVSNPNPNALTDNGNTGATGNIVHRQHLMSGTGSAALVPAGTGVVTNNSLFVKTAAAADSAYAADLVGEGFDRYRVQGDGKVLRGFGSAQPDVVDTVGNGSPEGVVASAPGGRYARRDAPDADHASYFKGSGTGNTGWQRLTSTGYAAA